MSNPNKDKFGFNKSFPELPDYDKKEFQKEFPNPNGLKNERY